MRRASLLMTGRTNRRSWSISGFLQEDGLSQSHVSLLYYKPVIDRVTGLGFNAITWENARMGLADDSEALNVVSQLLDEFLAAYLRVNAAACE